MDLGWFLGGSGRPLGGHWGSKIEFFRAFIAISIKIRILRHLGVLWGWFWEGLGTVLGGFWQGLGALRALFCFLGVFLGTLRALLGALGQFLVELLFIFVDFYQVLASPIAEASEASEQSERAKLSGACSGFPLLTHAFAGVPLLSLAFCCFASLHVVWHFLLNGTLAFPHSCSILFLVAPCLVLFSLVLPCANIS